MCNENQSEEIYRKLDAFAVEDILDYLDELGSNSSSPMPPGHKAALLEIALRGGAPHPVSHGVLRRMTDLIAERANELDSKSVRAIVAALVERGPRFGYRVVPCRREVR